MVVLYLHSPIRLHGVVLNLLGMGTTAQLRAPAYTATPRPGAEERGLITRGSEYYKVVEA
jgi:hypothetical protein